MFKASNCCTTQTFRLPCKVSNPRPAHTTPTFPYPPNVDMTSGKQTLTVQQNKHVLAKYNRRKAKEEAISQIAPAHRAGEEHKLAITSNQATICPFEFSSEFCELPFYEYFCYMHRQFVDQLLCL